MAISQNGYPVIDRSDSTYLTKIPKIIGRVRKDAGVAEIFEYFVLWFDQNIEDVDRGADDWGWNVRPIRGQTTGYSNHASGTAIDLNAMLHPRGKSKTFTAAQSAKIRKKLKELGGVIRWGGDYNPRISKLDEMHFEIDAPASKIEAVLKKLGKPVKEGDDVKPVVPTPSTPSPLVKENSKNTKQDNINITKLLNSQGYNAGTPDGRPDAQLRDAVKAYQKDQIYFPGMSIDGNWYEMTQAHFKWVKGLQAHLDEWAVVERNGLLAEDGNYKSLTGQRVEDVQRANPDLYKKAGGAVFDRIAGPIFCKMIGYKKHPSA